MAEAKRRGSVQQAQDAVLRGSVLLHKMVIEELSEGTIGPQKVVPDDVPALTTTTPATASTAESTEGSGTAEVALPLLDDKIPFWRHIVVENSESVVGAFVSGLLLYLIFRLNEYISVTFVLERTYVYFCGAIVSIELVLAAMYGTKNGSISPTLYGQLFFIWPTFFVLTALIALSKTVRRSSGDSASSPAKRLAGPLLLLAAWGVAISSKYIYRRIKGLKTSSYPKVLLSSVIFASVCGFMNQAPSLAVLVPVRYLAVHHPYWNIVVTGLCFPAFTFVMRKLLLGYFMSLLKTKVERGDLAADQVLSKYATVSKIITIALQLTNIVAMFFSSSVVNCVLSAQLSVLTEVGGKVYVVKKTRGDVKRHLASIAKKGAKTSTKSSTITAALGWAVVEPGVLSIQTDVEETKDKERALATCATSTLSDSWLSDAKLDHANRENFKAGQTDPGSYTKDEDDKIAGSLQLIDKLDVGNVDKYPDIRLTPHDMGTPLREAFMCHDSKSNVTYGKVTAIVHGASILDVVALLADYLSNNNQRHNKLSTQLESRILERVNNHHQVWYYQGRGTGPFHNRDFVWSFIVKCLSDGQYVCVLQPTTHKDAPILPNVVRAESKRIYRITKIDQNVTKLELLATVDLKGHVPSWITRKVVIPTALRVDAPLYFFQLMEHDDYDTAGEDAKTLGQLFVDELRNLKGEALDDALRTLFDRTAVLRYLRDKCPWLEKCVATIVKNKLAVADEGQSWEKDDSDTVNDPESVGKALARHLQTSRSPEEGVKDWINFHQALVTLDEQEPSLFRPFVIVVATKLLAEEETRTGARPEEENWQFVLCMLAARWGQDIVAEKSLILVAAFIIYLFDLSKTASTRDLLEITGIFYGFEIVTDALLVYVLDKYYDLPIRRLPRKTLIDFVKETVVLSQIVIGCACGLNIAYSFVNGDS